MRVLITGSREYTDADTLRTALDTDLKTLHWAAVEDYDRTERAAGRPVSPMAANLAGLRAVYDHGVAAGLRMVGADLNSAERYRQQTEAAIDAEAARIRHQEAGADG